MFCPLIYFGIEFQKPHVPSIRCGCEVLYKKRREPFFGSNDFSKDHLFSSAQNCNVLIRFQGYLFNHFQSIAITRDAAREKYTNNKHYRFQISVFLLKIKLWKHRNIKNVSFK